MKLTRVGCLVFVVAALAAAGWWLVYGRLQVDVVALITAEPPFGEEPRQVRERIPGLERVTLKEHKLTWRFALRGSVPCRYLRSGEVHLSYFYSGNSLESITYVFDEACAQLLPQIEASLAERRLPLKLKAAKAEVGAWQGVDSRIEVWRAQQALAATPYESSALFVRALPANSPFIDIVSRPALAATQPSSAPTTRPAPAAVAVDGGASTSGSADSSVEAGSVEGVDQGDADTEGDRVAALANILQRLGPLRITSTQKPKGARFFQLDSFQDQTEGDHLPSSLSCRADLIRRYGSELVEQLLGGGAEFIEVDAAATRRFLDQTGLCSELHPAFKHYGLYPTGEGQAIFVPIKLSPKIRLGLAHEMCTDEVSGFDLRVTLSLVAGDKALKKKTPMLVVAREQALASQTYLQFLEPTVAEREAPKGKPGQTRDEVVDVPLPKPVAGVERLLIRNKVKTLAEMNESGQTEGVLQAELRMVTSAGKEITIARDEGEEQIYDFHSAGFGDLVVLDVDADGEPDFIYTDGAGARVLILTRGGKVERTVTLRGGYNPLPC